MQTDTLQPAAPAEAKDSRPASDKAVVCKEWLGRLAWRCKIGWVCVGGHFIDANGIHSCGNGHVAYRYVWMHKRSHEIRIQDRPNIYSTK